MTHRTYFEPLILWDSYSLTPYARLEYIDSYNAQLEYAPGVRVPLSTSLPVDGNFSTRSVANWFKNQLPEDKGVILSTIKTLGINIGKSWYQVLSALNEDMPGNFILLPEGTEPHMAVKEVQLVNEDFINLKIKEIKSQLSTFEPFGRLSLGGMQSKFSLGNNGYSWYISDIFNPSTHIFKPAPKRIGFEDIEVLEHATLLLANVCGVRAANSSIYRSGDLTSYCVERFDRTVDSTGRIARLYQEDLAQVLGVSRADKYRAKPTDLTARLRENGMPEDELYTWVSQVAFNVFVGNADAHSKNYSITRDEEGVPSFTPLYDSINLSTLPVKQTLAMPINGVRYSQEVTAMDWYHWGKDLGLDGDRTVTAAQGTAQKIKEHYKDVYSFQGLDSFTYANIEGNLRGNL